MPRIASAKVPLAPGITYRPDIDGLRAIAVLVVVLFHARVRGFGGGFVGVDVFFVISGFLITNILLTDLGAGRFSIVRFYERRIRRIFPALFLVVGVTTLLGAALLTPHDYQNLGQSVTAATLFASNVLFWADAGYFAGPAELKPLLHTWSLAIEEQFYIVFPLLLWLLTKRGRQSCAMWLTAFALVSFAASAVMAFSSPDTAFYLVPTRAWELLLGSILSLGVVPWRPTPPLRWAGVLIGLFLIAASVVFYSADTHFPGAAALAPTVGTALIILAGQGPGVRANRLLGAPPLVFIGLISYSLYLWHWPLLVFLRRLVIRDPQPVEIATVLAASLALSIASWRYVETPFRTKQALATRRAVFNFAAAAMVVLTAVGVWIHFAKGFPARLGGQLAEASGYPDPLWDRWGECQDRLARADSTHGPCEIGATAAEPSFILWGDSHARALATAVHLSATRSGASGKIATLDQCPPLLGIRRVRQADCVAFNNRVLAYVAQHSELRTVILAARWAVSAQGSLYGREAQLNRRFQARLVDTRDQVNTERGNVQILESGLRRTVEQLRQAGREVVVVSQVPEVGFDVPAAFLAARWTRQDAPHIVAPRLVDYSLRNAHVTEMLDRLAATKQLRVIDPWRQLCQRETCKVAEGDRPLYRDDDHLSTFGASYISPTFDSVFDRAGAARAGR